MLKRICLFSLLILFIPSLCFSQGLERYKEGIHPIWTEAVWDTNDNSTTWTIVGTASDTSRAYEVKHYVNFASDYRAVDSDSIDLTIIAEVSLGGTYWMRYDSTSAFTDSAVYVVKKWTLSPTYFMRFIVTGGGDNKKAATGTDLTMTAFFQQ